MSCDFLLRGFGFRDSQLFLDNLILRSVESLPTEQNYCMEPLLGELLGDSEVGKVDRAYILCK